MEPVTSIVRTIFTVLQKIAEAEMAVRRNRTRCRELAGRAQVVSNILDDAGTEGDSIGDGAAPAGTRRIILCRLREALGDALELIESCGQRDDSCLSWFSARLYSGARANRFDDVHKRINNCLIELSAASGASIEKKIDRLDGRKSKPKETKAGKVPQKGATNKGDKQNGGKGGGKPKGGKNKENKATATRRAPEKGGTGKSGKRKGGKKNKKATASRPPPPALAHAGVPFHPNHHYSIEEDPTSCSVM